MYSMGYISGKLNLWRILQSGGTGAAALKKLQILRASSAQREDNVPRQHSIRGMNYDLTVRLRCVMNFGVRVNTNA